MCVFVRPEEVFLSPSDGVISYWSIPDCYQVARIQFPVLKTAHAINTLSHYVSLYP